MNFLYGPEIKYFLSRFSLRIKISSIFIKTKMHPLCERDYKNVCRTRPQVQITMQFPKVFLSLLLIAPSAWPPHSHCTHINHISSWQLHFALLKLASALNATHCFLYLPYLIFSGNSLSCLSGSQHQVPSLPSHPWSFPYTFGSSKRIEIRLTQSCSQHSADIGNLCNIVEGRNTNKTVQKKQAKPRYFAVI